MSDVRWGEVDRLFHAALALAPDARVAFLRGACGADESLFEEVTSLLDHAAGAESFLPRSAAEEASELAAGTRAALVGRQLGDYRILARIGGGGTGDVFHARDLRLGRDVALKVLVASPFGDAVDVRAVEREARAASVLNHPNIVTIYGVGEDNDVGYIAMELVRGRTLRELLAAGPLPAATGLEAAIQLADALAAAHASGIVHGDLKPDNIMMTPEGRLKVLDFGIARRFSRTAFLAATPGRDESSSGTVVGTAAYIAPEQAKGLPAGPAADQFAFGVTLCEMLTSVRIFERDTTTATLQAIASEPIAGIAADLPADAQAVIVRCLEKEPAARFASMADVAAALRAVAGPRRPRGLMRRDVLWLGAASLVAAGAGLAAWSWSDAPVVRSLAVLPFDNASRDSSLDYLTRGLARAVRDQLARLPRWRVVPAALEPAATSGEDGSRRFSRLGVDAVLTGSLQRRDGGVTARVQLRSAGTGRIIWASAYQGHGDDMKGVRDAIVEDIVGRALQWELSGADRRRLSSETASPEAFDLYLRAFQAHQQGGEEDLLDERALLERAIAIDPLFARAYVALASTHSVMAVEGLERPKETFPETNRYLRRALEIDPDLPDVHAETASYHFFCNWNWTAADNAWDDAERSGHGGLQPDLLVSRALQRWALGRADEALALVRRARAVDGLSPSFMVNEANYLVQLNRLDEAAALYESASRGAPGDARPYLGLAEVRLSQNQPDLALSATRQAHLAQQDLPVTVIQRAKGPAGLQALRRMAAEQELARLERRAVLQYVSPLDVARTHAELGHVDKALDELEHALEDRSPGLVFLNVDRTWAAVRTHARFRRVLQAVGLP